MKKSLSIPYYIFFLILSLGRVIIISLVLTVFILQLRRSEINRDLLNVFIFSIGGTLVLRAVLVYRFKILKITGRNGCLLTAIRDSRGRGLLIDASGNTYSLSSIFGWKIKMAEKET